MRRAGSCMFWGAGPQAPLAPGSSRPAVLAGGPRRLRKTIEPIVSSGELAAAFWGIEVRSLESGRTLYALNSGKAFRPASTLKLVTTAAALDAYGADARIRTTLETAGRLDSLGRILGDVFLVGRGDPNLSARFSPGRPTAAFEAMAEALVAAGVKRIEGHVIGHEGAFVGDRRGSSWTWEDLAWGYGTEISALSYADNLVEAQLAPGERLSDPAVLKLVPDSGCLNVVSTVSTMEAAPPLRRGDAAARARLERRAFHGAAAARWRLGRPPRGRGSGELHGRGVRLGPRGEGHRGRFGSHDVARRAPHGRARSRRLRRLADGGDGQGRQQGEPEPARRDAAAARSA